MTSETQGAKRSSEPLDFQALIETIPALVICTLADGSAEFANRAWHEYTGRSSPERTDWSWQTAIHTDDLPRLIQEWTATSTSMFEMEARVRRADGEYQWFAMRKALAVSRDQVGKPSLRAFIACEDIHERKQAQVRLEQNEQRWRTAFENSAIGIMMRDREGRFIAANSVFQNMVGYTESELCQLSFMDVTYEEDRKAELELSGEVLEGKRQHYQIEKRYRRKDGAVLWVRNNVALVPGMRDVAPFLFAVVEDITQRKQEESARRYSEERYRVVVETANDAVVSADESGAIQFANPATLRVFGYEPEELIGKPLTVLMPEFLRKLHENGFRRYLTTGQRHVKWQGNEFTGLRKNGQEFPVEVSFGELTMNGQRVFTGFIRDITERKRAVESLRRSEGYLAEAQRLTRSGSWAWDVRTGSLFWSRETFRIYGLDPEQQPSWPQFLARIHPDDRAAVEARANMESTQKDWTDSENDFRIVMPDGRIKHLHYISHPVKDAAGDLTEVVGTIIDVTERRLAEQERERLRQAQADLAHINRVSTMGELTASLAHEIKQPVSAAVINAEICQDWLARDQPDIAEAQQAASRLFRDLTRLSNIITRIGSLFKKGVPQRKWVNLNELIQEMISLLQGEAARHSISLHGEFDDGIPNIMADRVGLQQVLMNLMLNGIEAMKDTGTPGSLTISSKRNGDDQLLVSVADTGTGLLPENAEQIFSAFFTSKTQGTGMGLTISRSIIESHGGRLWAAPNSGPGATFQFTLPVEAAANAVV